MKGIAVISLFFCSSHLFAQTPVKDNANNGQMKRMVYQQWDDWQPTPETNWLGLPKNMMGWLYWRVLHHGYWKGEDNRPYRASGPFPQNLASLTLQEKDDAKIVDSMRKVSETHLATFVSMSGGAADVAWSMYFGKKFDELTNQIPTKIISISAKHPVAAAKMLSNKYYLDYLEYLEIIKDKLQIIHNSLVDRGERMVSYLEIQKDLQKRNDIMNKMISNYIHLTKLPTVDQVKEAKTKTTIANNDAEIVKKILINFNF